MEGNKEAQKKGIKFGRPKIKIPNDFNKLYALWKNNEISFRKAGNILSVSHHTMKHLISEIETSL